jgi:hypothetical protein
MRAVQNTPEILRQLLALQVDFLVIGGVAAITHGASTFTDDFDILAPLTVENCRRLLVALSAHHPVFYQSLGKPLGDRNAERLAQFKNLYFDTDLGSIDILGSLPPLGDFGTVAPRATSRALFGHTCRILGLDDLIEVKRYVGRPKDKQVELELVAVRERLRRS